MNWQPLAAVARRQGQRLVQLGNRAPVMGETQRFLLLSIIIGIFAGLTVVCFHISIEFFSWATVEGLGNRSWWALVLWPAVGGGVAYFLTDRYFPAARGSGVNSTKAALYISDGYVPFSSVLGKYVSSTISIGTGNPMGPEDPALLMGSGIASFLGRTFRLTRDNMRMIAPIGAAAGIGAAFNTPITAVLFVMEEVVASWNAGVLGSIVLSAVSAVVVSRWYLGDDPLYAVPQFALTNYTELIVYALMGIISGYLSAWFTQFAASVRELVRTTKRIHVYLLPVLAGLLVGVIGVRVPEVFGAGYGAIDSALHDRYLWQFLLLLAALKMVTTSLCFAVGTPGGMFAPTLFIGAMIGGGVGGLAHEYWPFPTSTAGAYVLVGIGTFFAGLFRAPMTSIFMVFEISRSYVIILPVMVANVIALLISRTLQHDSLLQIAARQDGLDLPSVEEQRESSPLSVEDAMQVGSGRVFPSSTTVETAFNRMSEQELTTALIGVHGKGWSWVELEDISKAIEKGQSADSVWKALSVRAVVRLYPDLSLDSAMRVLATYPILPVSSRANPNLLLGTLTLEDVHKAYGIPEDTL
ncbi:MAG: chloride channel protein [Acidobacteria bacterium]|nr:chloride channel protein [Acidobacteriota bacterium]MDA1234885.1 chloride channel protein [Acidobacteriota bacterium]